MTWLRRAAAATAVLAATAGTVWAAHTWLHRGTATQTALYATSTARTGSIVAEVSGSATLKPLHSAKLTSPAAGTVTAVDVRQGQKVSSGQVLATISDPQLAQKIVQANLKVHADLQTLAAATGETPAQAAAVNPAAGIRVHAPQSGLVTAVDASQGAQVSAGQALATIVDRNSVVVQVDLITYDQALAKPGSAVRVHFQGFTGWVNGTLRQVAAQGVPSSSGGTEVYPAQVAMRNPGLLRPGDKGEAQLRSGALWLTIPGTAKITGYGHEATVRSPIAATLQAVRAAVDSPVRSGQTLFLLGGGTASATITGDQLSLQQDEASLSALQTQQTDLTVRSPLSGVVSSVSATRGQTIATGASIARVYAPNAMSLTLPVSELQISHVHKGQTVRITTPGISGKSFQGSVVAVNTVGSSSGGLATFDVSVLVNGGGKLLPGMTANAQIVTAKASNALLVPVEAVIQQSSGAEVEVLSSGVVSTRKVRVGLVNSTQAQILSGLRAGETVVTGAANGAMANAVKASLTAHHKGPGGGGPGKGGAPNAPGAPPAGKSGGPAAPAG